MKEWKKYLFSLSVATVFTAGAVFTNEINSCYQGCDLMDRIATGGMLVFFLAGMHYLMILPFIDWEKYEVKKSE